MSITAIKEQIENLEKLADEADAKAEEYKEAGDEENATIYRNLSYNYQSRANRRKHFLNR